MTATKHNELVSPDQLAERLGISLRMVREMDYTNYYEQILELREPRPTTLVRKPDQHKRHPSWPNC